MEYQNILFIDVDNYYLSRYAEIFFNHWAKKYDLKAKAFSRGCDLNSLNEGNISEYALSALEEMNIPVDLGRVPVQLHREDFLRAHIIIVLNEEENKPFINLHFPEYVDSTNFWSFHDVQKEPPEIELPRLSKRIDQLIEALGVQKFEKFSL